MRDNSRSTAIYYFDLEMLDAVRLLSRTENVVPELESAHAVAGAIELAGRFPWKVKGGKKAWRRRMDQAILVGLPDRGDKDMETARQSFPELA